MTSAKTTIWNLAGERKGEATLPAKIFSQEFDSRVLSEAVVALEKRARPSVAHAKDRGSVRGGGRKPWRQKGTGRARHGSIRSPIWRGGGVTHGPTKDRKYEPKLNSRLRKKALAMALSQKLRADEIILVSEFKSSGKTKDLVSQINILLKGRPAGSVLIVAGAMPENLKRASRNIPRLLASDADKVGLLDTLRSKYIILDEEALKVLEKRPS